MQHFGKRIYGALSQTVVNKNKTPTPTFVAFSELPPALQDLIKTSRYLDASIFSETCLKYSAGTKCCIYSFGPLRNHIWNFVLVAIDVLNILFGENLNTIHIALAYSNETKMLPSGAVTIIEPKHVNSGVSIMRDMCCVIYRREEMQKVILHELMHLWGVDAQRNEMQDRKVEKQFGIQSLYTTIRLGETYNDTLCCILISGMRAFKPFKPKQTLAQFQVAFKTELDKTKQHVFEKAANVIQFYSKQSKWIEATHAFSYYVGKALCFERLHELDAWLNNQTGAHVNFYSFIMPLCMTTAARNNLSRFKKYTSTSRSLRMMPLKST